MTTPRLFEDQHFLHSPQPIPPTLPTSPQHAGLDNGDRVCHEASEEHLPPPDFKPFFTLIHDPDTGEHYHPCVHYIFSDDDRDLLTSAMLEAVHLSEEQDEPTATRGMEAEERFVVLDITPDGKKVSSAVSLSPHWQSLRTEIAQAPSWGDSGETKDRGLMLKISGTEARAQQHGQEKQAGRVEDMIKAFNDRLEGLDELLGNDGDTVG